MYKYTATGEFIKSNITEGFNNITPVIEHGDGPFATDSVSNVASDAEVECRAWANRTTESYPADDGNKDVFGISASHVPKGCIVAYYGKTGKTH